MGGGSVVSHRSRKRLLNRDGSFNVRREGLGYFRSLSAYHWLFGMTWPRFARFSGVFNPLDGDGVLSIDVGRLSEIERV